MFKARLYGMLFQISVSFILMATSGCADLTGVPKGLSADQISTLAKSDGLDNALKVAGELDKVYQDARDDNLRFAFWSNAPLIPLAGGAAGAIFTQADGGILAGIGILSGTIFGMNSFVNARANAKVYQSGITGLRCVVTKLSQYKTTTDDALNTANEELSRSLIEAQQVLDASQGTDLTSEDAQKERTDNPSAVTTLATSEKMLSQAIADAQHAQTSAEGELLLYKQLPIFVAGSVLNLDNLVASRISQTDVNYSGLVSTLAQLTSAPAAPATTQKVAAAVTTRSLFHKTDTPMATAAANSMSGAKDLSSKTTTVVELTNQFALSTREKEVGDCIKAL